MANVGSYLNRIEIDGDELIIKSLKMKAIETAPASATAEGVLGDIVIAADGLYLCTVGGAGGAATWVKAVFATFV